MLCGFFKISGSFLIFDCKKVKDFRNGMSFLTLRQSKSCTYHCNQPVKILVNRIKSHDH